MQLRRLAPLLRDRGDLLGRVLLGAGQIAAIAWFSPGRGLPLDDAWIHQVVARTFAETGTLGYAPGQHGAAATSYLWAALLAIGFKLRILEATRWALVLNGLATLATGQLLHSLVLRARPAGIAPRSWHVTSLVVALLASISPNILWFTVSGMEAMPFVALSLTAIWAATTNEERRRHAVIAGVAAGALALLRPEAAPLGGLLAAHALWRKRRQSIAAIAAPWIACVAIYVGSNIVKTGHAAPSTLAGRRWLWFEMTSGLSRTDRALDFLDAWTTRLGSFTFDTSPAVIWILIAIAAYGALRLVRGSGARLRDTAVSEDAPKLLFAWALFHATFYLLLLPTPGHGGRYQPFTPLLFAACLPLGTAFFLREVARVAGSPEKLRFGWFAALGSIPWIALAAPVTASLRHANALAVAHIQATEMGAGTFLNELPEGTIASFDIGGTGWASSRPVVDLGGLSDPKTAALLETGRISTWLEENQVRWLVLPQSYEPVLPVFEDYRARLHLAENPALRLVPVRVFETPFDKWQPSIRATWNAAPKQVVYEVLYTKRPGPREVAMIAPDALRPIPDPARLVPARERVVAEHMLATLAAWDLPIDVRLAPTRPAEAASNSSAPAAELGAASEGTTGPCTITLGWWGFAVEDCSAVGAPDVLRTLVYEHAGRYIDVGDLGGALRAIPHVVAHAKRRIDPRFHPPLAPLMPPLPGGVFISPMRAGGFGPVVFLGSLLAAIGIELAGRRNVRVPRLVGLVRSRLFAVPTTAILLLNAILASVMLSGCSHDVDVAGAVWRGRGAVEIALANGGSADRAAGSRRIPLVDAALAGDAEIVSLLLSRGAKLDVAAPDGTTPLHHAARRGHHAAALVLASEMRRDAPSTVLDQPAGARRRTALHDAVAAGSVETVNVLLRAGADPNKADAFGQTPLHLVPAGDPTRARAIAVLLIDAGAEPGAADARGFTALHAAAAADNVGIVRAIPGSSDVLGKKTPSGDSALDIALRYGRDRAAEALVASGAVPSREDAWPPLHEAAVMDAVDRAASLIASAADTERRVHGKTALDLAVEHGSKRVEALLREHGK